jgi:hypothetical protein
MHTYLRQKPPFDHMDFAQEFLRRNPAYQAQYRNIVSGNKQRATRDENMMMTRTWGLEFPHPSQSRCIGSTCNLASGTNTIDHPFPRRFARRSSHYEQGSCGRSSYRKRSHEPRRSAYYIRGRMPPLPNIDQTGTTWVGGRLHHTIRPVA